MHPESSIMRRLTRQYSSASLRRSLAVLFTALALLPAGMAWAAQTSSEIDPQDDVVPNVVQKQQAEYRHLSNDVWNKRDIPAGLKHDVGPATPRDSGVKTVALAAHNVNFYLDDDVGYHVKNLKAELVPKDPSEPVNFDDPEQYRIHILSGQVLIRPKDLDALFNKYVLSYEPRSLGSVENHTSKDTLEVSVTARLFRFIPPVGGIPTTLSGPIKVSDDNQLVYTPNSVKQLGLPVKPLLSAVGMSLSAVTPLDRTGLKLKGNQLIMNPETLFPPPRLKIDEITKAQLSDDGLTLTFGSDTSDAGFDKPPVDSDSYIWLQAGDARFYGTVLVNANLELLNDGGKTLDFHLYDYRAQTAAGTIHSQEDGALIVRVPNKFDDIDDIPDQNTGLKRRSFGGDKG